MLADADLDLTLRSIIEAGFYNQGEACTAGSGVLAHRSIYEALIERLASAVKRLRVGSGMSPDTHVGPLVTQQQQQQRVLD